ncbi:MAG: hypothetical protein U0271_38050 [Polyangiaceae bacterium]
MRHSVDFGSTWQDIELPSVDDGSTPARTRRCSAMGCALPGWLRVGWGESAHADDLREAESPSTLKISTMKLSGAPLELSCSSVKSDKPPKTTGKIGEGQALTSWQAFRGVDPPLLDKEDVGVDNGSTYDANLVRFYVWGKRESDWSRTGRFIVRYADKYALEEVRSSAVTGSPWSSQGIASEALGMGAYSYGGAQWSTQRDLSAVLVGLCRPGVRACSLFAVEPDQPVLTLRPTEGVTLVRPFNNGAVRLGHVWFFLGDVGVSDQIGLYRADLGVVRLVGTFSRLPAGRFTAPVLPRLVRRQSGDQLGFMFVQREGPQDKRGSRWILPIDPETAAVGEAIRIGRPDFGDMDLTAPCGARDGWLAEIPTEQAPDFTLDGSSGRLDATEVRVRLEPGSACVEAAVGTVSSIFSDDPKAAKKEKAGASASAIPVVALDRSTNTRRELACTVTPKAKKR